MTLDRRQLIAGFAAIPLLASTEPSKAVIFEARKIVTMDPRLPVATHVAVADGTILGVSQSLAALKPLLSGRAASIDTRFAKAVLMPGLIDPHVHPMQSAVMLNLPFVAPEDWELPSRTYKGAQSPAQWRARLKEELARSDASPFICWGHHELFHGAVDRKLLDAIAPGRPVIIWQRSFHEVILNSAAIRSWGFGERAAFDSAIAAGKIDRRHADFDRGVFSETALMLALEKMRSSILTPARIQSGMAAMQTLMRKSGVTTISDMATGIFAGFDAEAGLVRAAFERADNPSRVMLMPIASEVPDDADLERWFDETKARWQSPHVRVDRRVKMLADGAFFAQNMMMNSPGYSDGHIGKWITEPDVLRAQFSRFWGAGFSLHVHVNGDQGLDVVLDGLSALGPARGGQSVTLEHLGYADPAQLRRIATMKLMVSAQPNYIRVLGDVYGKHGLGMERASRINPLGSLERLSVPLGLHSDFNMAPIDPLYLAWIAANRRTIGGRVRGIEERLSMEKALRAVTIDAARVIGMEALAGSVTAGKRADFAVLADDPYALGAGKLRDAHVEGLVFEGRAFAP
jgi:predicted amidohydrolase YtcJ